MAKKKTGRQPHKPQRPRRGGRKTGDVNLSTEVIVERCVAWKINHILGTVKEMAAALGIAETTASRITSRDDYRAKFLDKHRELMKASEAVSKQRVVDLAPAYDAGERKLLSALASADVKTLGSKGADLVIRRRMMQYEYELERLKRGDLGDRYCWLKPVPGRRMLSPWQEGVPITDGLLAPDVSTDEPAAIDPVGKSMDDCGFGKD